MSYAYPLHIQWHCVCGDVPESHVSRADREECHGHCQKTDHDCAGQGYRPIEHSQRTPAIEAIFTAAGSSDEHWPKHYTSDLSVDYKWLIAPDAPQRFIWILREMGTNLYPLDGGAPDGYVRAALRWMQSNHPEAHVFHWNGFSLVPVTYDTALTLAAVPPIKYERRAIPGTPFGYRVEA